MRKKNNEFSQYINLGIILLIFYIAWELVKSGGDGLKSLLNLGKAKNEIANSDHSSPVSSQVGEPIDTSACESVVAGINASLHWYNDDEDAIISHLNRLRNGSEVKYASTAYQDKYGISLKLACEGTLSDSEKSKVKAIVLHNWF
jgi:hypothetical protein